MRAKRAPNSEITTTAMMLRRSRGEVASIKLTSSPRRPAHLSAVRPIEASPSAQRITRTARGASSALMPATTPTTVMRWELQRPVRPTTAEATTNTSRPMALPAAASNAGRQRAVRTEVPAKGAGGVAGQAVGERGQAHGRGQHRVEQQPGEEADQRPEVGSAHEPGRHRAQQQDVAGGTGDPHLGEHALLEHGGGDQDERDPHGDLHDEPAGQTTTLTKLRSRTSASRSTTRVWWRLSASDDTEATVPTGRPGG